MKTIHAKDLGISPDATEKEQRLYKDVREWKRLLNGAIENAQKIHWVARDIPVRVTREPDGEIRGLLKALESVLHDARSAVFEKIPSEG
jgi:hypothetical protein